MMEKMVLSMLQNMGFNPADLSAKLETELQAFKNVLHNIFLRFDKAENERATILHRLDSLERRIDTYFSNHPDPLPQTQPLEIEGKIHD